MKLFSSKSKAAPVFALGADIHNHLIPGIDDGSPSPDESISMIEGIRSLGFERIVTTPHIMSDYFRNTPQSIENGLQRLTDKIAENNLEISIKAAAEYYIDYAFSGLIEQGALLSFGNNYILTELPLSGPAANLNEVFFSLQVKKYRPILAHPERYTYWLNQFDVFEDLKNRGVLFQLNLLSLTGHYSPLTKRLAEKLIDADMIDFVGTDLHRARQIELVRPVFSNKHFQKLYESGRLKNLSV